MEYRIELNHEALERAMIVEGVDSRSELARRSGMDRAHLGRILDGKRPVKPSHVHALAKALRVTPSALLAPDADTVAAIEEAVTQ